MKFDILVFFEGVPKKFSLYYKSDKNDGQLNVKTSILMYIGPCIIVIVEE